VVGGGVGWGAAPRPAPDPRPPVAAHAPACSHTALPTTLPHLTHSVALATRDGSSLLLFPVLRAGALAPGLASLVAPTPPRPAARAGAGTASWMAFQAMEPLRSEEHGER